jgi:hypothetical protein
MKAWQHHDDPVLRLLSEKIIHRQLFRIELRNSPFSPTEFQAKKTEAMDLWGLSEADAAYLVHTDAISNQPYESNGIQIRFKTGEVKDFAVASDHLTPDVLSRKVVKYFLCFPKEIG